MKFTPGPPKPARELTLPKLKKETSKVTAAKSVGSGVVKVFTDGDYNFYLDDSPELRQHLATFGVGV